MGISILNITVDCADAASTARFWSELTGWPPVLERMPGNPYWVVAGPSNDGPLVFVDVPGAKAVKNRVHLDLAPQDATQDEELERLLSLGARIIDDRRNATPGGWWSWPTPRATNSTSKPAEAPSGQRLTQRVQLNAARPRSRHRSLRYPWLSRLK